MNGGIAPSQQAAKTNRIGSGDTVKITSSILAQHENASIAAMQASRNGKLTHMENIHGS